MLGAELGAVDGSLLGDERLDGATLGSLLGINERLGWTEGPLLGAADLVGAELLGLTAGATDRLGCEDGGSALGAIMMCSSNEPDGVGFGDALGRDDGEPLGAGERFGVDLGLLLGISVGPIETVTDGVEEGLELGKLVGPMVDIVTVSDVGLFVGFSDGALHGETVNVGLPLPVVRGCREMDGANLGPGIGLSVDGLILGDSLGIALGVDDTLGAPLGSMLG
jgi:hypothetical protein